MSLDRPFIVDSFIRFQEYFILFSQELVRLCCHDVYFPLRKPFRNMNEKKVGFFLVFQSTKSFNQLTCQSTNHSHTISTSYWINQTTNQFVQTQWPSTWKIKTRPAVTVKGKLPVVFSWLWCNCTFLWRSGCGLSSLNCGTLPGKSSSICGACATRLGILESRVSESGQVLADSQAPVKFEG